MQHQKYMKTLRYRQYGLVIALSLLLCVGFAGRATATSSSANYSVNEVQFGSGGSLHDCSTNFCAKTSAGDTTVGNTSSTSYSALTGTNTTDVPLLEVTVAGGNQDLGTLDSTHTGTATMSIHVRTYLSNGYTLQITGAAPTQGSHHLRIPIGQDGSPFTSQQGVEQFGINMVANNTPGIGADPVAVPSGDHPDVIAAGYVTPNLFKYIDGDPVAASDVSNGEIDYTMSMILNVSNVTPGGHYSGTYSAVVVPTY